jgi:hypothetical protein
MAYAIQYINKLDNIFPPTEFINYASMHKATHHTQFEIDIKFFPNSLPDVMLDPKATSTGGKLEAKSFF